MKKQKDLVLKTINVKPRVEKDIKEFIDLLSKKNMLKA